MTDKNQESSLAPSVEAIEEWLEFTKKFARDVQLPYKLLLPLPWQNLSPIEIHNAIDDFLSSDPPYDMDDVVQANGVLAIGLYHGVHYGSEEFGEVVLPDNSFIQDAVEKMGPLGFPMVGNDEIAPDDWDVKFGNYPGGELDDGE